jgi:hypothetical protein
VSSIHTEILKKRTCSHCNSTISRKEESTELYEMSQSESCVTFILHEVTAICNLILNKNQVVSLPEQTVVLFMNVSMNVEYILGSMFWVNRVARSRKRTNALHDYQVLTLKQVHNTLNERKYVVCPFPVVIQSGIKQISMYCFRVYCSSLMCLEYRNWYGQAYTLMLVSPH